MNLQYRPVRREERGDVHSSSLLIDVYASFLTLSPTAGFNDPAEKFLDLLLKSDVNLFNHLVRKADVAVVVLRVLFVDMRLPRIQCR